MRPNYRRTDAAARAAPLGDTAAPRRDIFQTVAT
jgi:hypothetical protein